MAVDNARSGQFNAATGQLLASAALGKRKRLEEADEEEEPYSDDEEDGVEETASDDEYEKVGEQEPIPQTAELQTPGELGPEAAELQTPGILDPAYMAMHFANVKAPVPGRKDLAEVEGGISDDDEDLDKKIWIVNAVQQFVRLTDIGGINHLAEQT
ncbi:hypothetical protein HDU86_000541 [Geranomyces michiganensis]|nr:hypothetical protein HDU86_000541 [Geranomyces michiganensis]